MKIEFGSDVKGLIFDCDGTLVDTLEAHYAAWDNVFHKYSISVPPDYLDQFNSCPSRMIVEKINSDFGTSHDEIRLAAEKEDYLTENMGIVHPIEPVLQYVRNYHGRLPMVVISGGVRKNVVKSLEALDLLKYFEMIVCADDEHPPKTDPLSFTILADKMKLDPKSCVVFEDGDVGIASARIAGMQIVDVRSDV